MPEQNKVHLCWWNVFSETGTHRLSEEEMGKLLDADSKGARFVMFDGFVLNTAFVRGAERVKATKDPEFHSLKGEEKFILLDERKMLK